MSVYLKLIKANTPYAKRMNRLSNRIFGEVVRQTDESSMRVVKLFKEKPPYDREELVNYYPKHIETYKFMMKLRSYGLYRDEHQDFNEEMVRAAIARGKVKSRRKGKMEAEKTE